MNVPHASSSPRPSAPRGRILEGGWLLLLGAALACGGSGGSRDDGGGGTDGVAILEPAPDAVRAGDRIGVVAELAPGTPADGLVATVDGRDVTAALAVQGLRVAGEVTGLAPGDHELVIRPAGRAGAAVRFRTRPIRVLFFSRTEGFRHRSIEDAKALFAGLDPSAGLETTFTEETALFTDQGLAGFDVLVFANTTGDVLDAPEEEALVRFVRSGKGWVGVHSATDTEHDWPWYGQLAGAFFVSHPPIPFTTRVTTETTAHPATSHLPATWDHQDEWYEFDRNPRTDNVILLTIPGLPGFLSGPDHPVAWAKEFEGGRSFYTNLGHRPETWQSPLFVEHLLGGIRWAAQPVTWNRVVLSQTPRNPTALAVANDGRVFWTELDGELWSYLPASGRSKRVARLDVSNDAENGLLGLVLDPDFAQNGQLYLYHSAPGTPAVPPPVGAGPPAVGENVLSRFVVAADGTLDLASRADLLRVPSDRACCHEGGGLAIGPDGLLYVSVGDNTDPFESAGFAPLDGRPGRERFDARRTAGNAFELRGKILRIGRDGSIPDGNLYPRDGSAGRAEIYVSGVRNPFRIAVDPVSGRLWWGDVGPDAIFDSNVGPRGYDEIDAADAPGSYGWPYCIGPNYPYAARDPASSALLAPFSCDGFVPATMFYDYTRTTYPALGSVTTERAGFAGRTAIAGVLYRTPHDAAAPYALPSTLEGALLMTDFTRDVVAALRTDATGAVASVERLAPFQTHVAPIDLERGPEGALYVLEFGSGLGSASSDARLSRLEHSPGGHFAPVAAAAAEPRAGRAPLTVRLDAAGSHAWGVDDELAAYEWDVDGDGTVDAATPEVTHTYGAAGTYAATLTVVGRSGRRSPPSVVDVIVGNGPPDVTIDAPADGTTVRAGSLVRLVGHATDVEDGEVPCEDLVWDVRLGHNAHSHPIEQQTGCEASFVASLGGHDEGTLFYVVELRVTDGGGTGGEPPLTGRAEIRLGVTPGDGGEGACFPEDIDLLAACAVPCDGREPIDFLGCFVDQCLNDAGEFTQACQFCLVEAGGALVIGSGVTDLDALGAGLRDACEIDVGSAAAGS